MRLCKRGGLAVLALCSTAAIHTAALPSGFGRCALWLPVLAAGAAVEQATNDQKRAAQQAFEQGSKAFSEKRYDDAIARFRASYEIVASPNTYVMLGRALRGAGRPVEAYETLLEASERARAIAKTQPRYAKAADVADAELGSLRVEVALVSLRVEGVDRAEVTAGGKAIPEQRYTGFPVAPGSLKVIARAADGRSVEQTVVAEAGGSHEAVLRFAEPKPAEPPPPAPEAPSAAPPAALSANVAGATLPPPEHSPADTGPPSERASLKPWAWVATGVGVAGFATFAAAGLMARGTENDLEAACANDLCPSDQRETVDRGRREQTIANIGLVVGAVGAVTAVTLFVLDQNHATSATLHGCRVGLAIGPGWAGVKGRL